MLILGMRNKNNNQHMQDTLNPIYNWQESNNMKRNDTKFVRLSIFRNVGIRQSLLFTPDYTHIIDQFEIINT